MIHVLVTQTPAIRDACIAHYDLHPHATASEVYQKEGTLLVYSEIL